MNVYENDESVKRAELFDVLGHPTRIKILKTLQRSSMTFAELKRALEIESSGNLQHHLGKLGDLLKQTEDGKYAITDDAKEALRLLDVMEQARGQGPIAGMSEGSTKTKLSLLALAAITTILLFAVFYQYSLLARSVSLFDTFDFSKDVLDLMGEKYHYLMLTIADLQNSTRIAFRGAAFTYIDLSHYLYLARPNVGLQAGARGLEPPAVTSWSLIYPRYFRVEFENGEVEKIAILPWPLTYAANSLVNIHRLSPIALYNISLVNGKTLPFIISTEDLDLFAPRAGSKAYAFQIGPDTIMLLLRDDK